MTKGTRINIWAEIQNENLFSILNWGSYSIWVGWHEVCEAYEWHTAQMALSETKSHLSEYKTKAQEWHGAQVLEYRTKILLAIKRKSKYSIYSFEGISNLETVRFLFFIILILWINNISSIYMNGDIVVVCLYILLSAFEHYIM